MFRSRVFGDGCWRNGLNVAVVVVVVASRCCGGFRGPGAVSGLI